MAVNSTSISPSAWAYTDTKEPITTHGNLTYTYAKGMTGYNYPGIAVSIFHFDIPSIVSTSKVNKVIVNFNTRIAWEGNFDNRPGSAKVITLYYSCGLTGGYKVDTTITANNKTALLTQGVKTNFNSYTQYDSYISHQIDITSIFANNIENGLFTLVIENAYATPLKISTASVGLAINYESVDPVPPVLVSPVGTLENRSDNIKLNWIYKSNTEASQASATIKYKESKDTDFTSVTVTGTNNYYEFAANTLSIGTYTWKVCTTDSNGQTSDYSQASFTVIDKPSVPIITEVENKCISKITWSSAEQVAYEIQALKDDELVYSTKVSSSENSFTPNMFFSNETYTIKVRVCSQYGLWSEWGSKTYKFTFTNPTKPSITLSQSNNQVIITTDVANAFLYKSDDGISYKPIYKFDIHKKFVDHRLANGKIYKYFVRSYESGYSDSDIETACINFNGIVLQNDEISVNATKTREQTAKHDVTLYIEKAEVYFAGRTNPVIEFGEHNTISISKTVLIDKKQYDDLLKLFYSATPLTYRDNEGNIFECSLEVSLRKLEFDRYSVDITVKKIDYCEEVNTYD